MAPAQALQAMLAGTGVSADISGPSTAALVSGSGRAAAALGAPVNADGSLVLDTITISGGGNPADAPYRSSGSGAYISAGQIERFRGTSTGDMLKSTPGVIASANRNGASLEVNIRGVQGMNRVKVTVDGSEQTIAEGQGYPGSRTRSYVDPDLIAGIEIEKGPQMSGAGAGAISGSVNMRTLDVQDILKDGKQFGMRLKGRADVQQQAAATHRNHDVPRQSHQPVRLRQSQRKRGRGGDARRHRPGCRLFAAQARQLFCRPAWQIHLCRRMGQ
ncbi:TonB-dependent receptor plug domain-containing protein [Aquamicrobium terrae]